MFPTSSSFLFKGILAPDIIGSPSSFVKSLYVTIYALLIRVGPVGPIAPVGPIGPVGPISPLGPFIFPIFFQSLVLSDQTYISPSII